MKPRVHRYCPKCNHHEMRVVGKRRPLYWCLKCGTPHSQPLYLNDMIERRVAACSTSSWPYLEDSHG